MKRNSCRSGRAAVASALWLAIGLGTSPAAFAGPVVLRLEPASNTVSLGAFVTVDLTVSGLDPSPGGPSLGAYFVDILHDATRLGAVGVSFGSDLNSTSGGLLNQFSDLSTAGLVHLNEISEFLPDDLNAAQGDSFRLATLTFQGLSTGDAVLSIDSLLSSLSNEDGLVSLDFSTVDTVIRVVPDGADSRTFGSLAGLGLWGFVRSRDRRRRS